MKLSDCPVYPTSKISYYADRVIRDLKLKEPPIFVDPILEYFGIGLHWIDTQTEFDFEKEKGFKVEIPALLYRKKDKPIIFVRENDKYERRRLSVFHECGHFDIPWHGEHNYLCECSEKAINDLKRFEKQAYEYASNIIFPRRLFFEEVCSLPIGLAAMEILAKRYSASFEATAIHYVKYSPEQCAILYLFNNPDAYESGYPFLVDYSIVSKRFDGFWHKGEPISYSAIFENCFADKGIHRSDIPAGIFGSSKHIDYYVEAKRYGYDKICVFLRLPDNQLRIY